MDNGNNNINKIAEMAAEKLGMSPNEVIKAAKSGKANELLQRLNPQDAQKIKEFLSDKENLQKLLSSDKAKSMLEGLFGNKM